MADAPRIPGEVRMHPALVPLRALVRPVPCIAGQAAAILTRLALAQVFIVAGWGKITDLATATENFTGWGIPMPELNAWMVGRIELVGGVLIALGLLTRASAALLASTMVVALLTAHRSQIWPALTLAEGDITDVLPVPLLILQLWLVAYGAGFLSLDRLRRWLWPFPWEKPAATPSPTAP
jgi:putative oxidoreductase